MNGLAVVIGNNIEKLRVSKNIAKTELAHLLGVSRPTLDNYIKGKQIIDSGKLALLAKKFSKSMDYFLSPTNEGRSSLMYRAERASDTPEEIIDGILRRFELYSNLLQSNKQKSVFNPPTYSIRFDNQQRLSEKDKNAIEEVAVKCRQALFLDSCTGQDLFLALEETGIGVLAFPVDPSARVWGASAYSHEDGAFIYVNDDASITEERKIFSLVHELGHLIMHRDGYSQIHSELKYVSRRRDINEKAADHFTSCFLLPRHKLEQEARIMGGDISFSGIVHLKKKYKVSFQAVVMALANYGFISNQESKRFFAALNSRGYNKTEPMPLPYFEKNNRFTLHLQSLYRNGDIGLNKVAEYLELPLMEARKVVREWGVEG